MARNSRRSVNIIFSGELVANNTYAAAENTVSPGDIDIITLAAATFTAISPPTGGKTCTGLTIVPPAGNLNTITLKGVTGDTGIVIHKTDPTSIGLNSPTTSIGFLASAEIVGVQLIWT